MKSLSSWLLAMFMFMFWAFRIMITIATQYGSDGFGGFIVFNMTFEIVMLFVSLLCFVLFIRRMLLGGIIYLVGYGVYFGNYIITNAIPTLISSEEMDMIVLENVILAVLGIILGLCLTLDIVFERARAKHFSDNKTDWFFDNKNYDRQFDERADRNQYKF